MTSGPTSSDLKSLDQHFAFGENWAQYAKLIDERRIAEGKAGLSRLLTADELRGRSVLDVGCGSGLHSLAALLLGAGQIRAVDIDPNSVKTTQAVLDRYAAGMAYTVEQRSIFEMRPENMGQFDIVYSWGVLHHTGAMLEAVTSAAALVRPGGYFAFALYRKTRLCGVWTRIKRWYSRATPDQQATARRIYIALFKLRCRLRGQDFEAYRRDYASLRGMNFEHDVHDWIGGYPYESIAEHEVDSLVLPLGFEPVRRVVSPLAFGFFGSGCDEYVFRRP